MGSATFTTKCMYPPPCINPLNRQPCAGMGGAARRLCCCLRGYMGMTILQLLVRDMKTHSTKTFYSGKYKDPFFPKHGRVRIHTSLENAPFKVY